MHALKLNVLPLKSRDCVSIACRCLSLGNTISSKELLESWVEFKLLAKNSKKDVSAMEDLFKMMVVKRLTGDSTYEMKKKVVGDVVLKEEIYIKTDFEIPLNSTVVNWLELSSGELSVVVEIQQRAEKPTTRLPNVIYLSPRDNRKVKLCRFRSWISTDLPSYFDCLSTKEEIFNFIWDNQKKLFETEALANDLSDVSGADVMEKAKRFIENERRSYMKLIDKERRQLDSNPG